MDAWMTIRSKINRGIFTWLILNAQLINLVLRYTAGRKEDSLVLWVKTCTTSLNWSWHWSISILCPWHLQFYFWLSLLGLCMKVCVCLGHARVCVCVCEVCGLCGVYIYMCAWAYGGLTSTLSIIPQEIFNFKWLLRTNLLLVTGLLT